MPDLQSDCMQRQPGANAGAGSITIFEVSGSGTLKKLFVLKVELPMARVFLGDAKGANGPRDKDNIISIFVTSFYL